MLETHRLVCKLIPLKDNSIDIENKHNTAVEHVIRNRFKCRADSVVCNIYKTGWDGSQFGSGRLKARGDGRCKDIMLSSRQHGRHWMTLADMEISRTLFLRTFNMMIMMPPNRCCKCNSVRLFWTTWTWVAKTVLLC